MISDKLHFTMDAPLCLYGDPAYPAENNKEDKIRSCNYHAILETTIIVLLSKVPVSNFLACFNRVFSFQTGLGGNPCNITLKTSSFSYHKIRSKKSHIVTNYKTNNTKLEHVNVATSVLTSKVGTSIFYSVSSSQTIRREVRTIPSCKNVCCKRRGTGCKLENYLGDFLFALVDIFQ